MWIFSPQIIHTLNFVEKCGKLSFNLYLSDDLHLLLLWRK